MNQNTALLVFVSIGVVIVAAIITMPLIEHQTPSGDNGSYSVGKFSSLEELKSFLKNVQLESNSYSAYFGLRAGAEKSVSSAVNFQSSLDSSGASSYSQTNNQVEGVDEADMIKNDNKYIYIASQENITIVDAYPAENASILSITDINGTATNLFLNKDKLVVFGTERYDVIPMREDSKVACADDSGCILPPRYSEPRSFVKVYDISDRSNPELFNEIYFDGYYIDSRMIGNNIYLIANQPVRYYNSEPTIPVLYVNDKTIQPSISDIYYFDIPDYGYQFTTILSFNVGSKDVRTNNFLTGYTQNIYVSEDNIYLTSTKQMPRESYDKIILEKVILPLVDSKTREKIKEIQSSESSDRERSEAIKSAFETFYNNLPESEKVSFYSELENKTLEISAEIEKEMQKTVIHKISVSNGEIEYSSRGEVPGVVLNQFSMDEYKGNFRIATTSGNTWQGNSLNHIYVLDSDLNIIGKLEDLAQQERIYSVRFMGNRAYMVTFKSIDPLFVIDLSNAKNPEVLGELKIPGYSDYLHPYDEDHIIGIGKDVDESIDSDKVHSPGAVYYTAVGGLKISLFDVSDVSNPKEISKLAIGDRGTDSQALYDHKAFLFDKDKGIIVIPVTLMEMKDSSPSYDYGIQTFIGAYIFSINLQDGIKYSGRITHSNETNQETYDYTPQIQRSLFLDNTLYTLSQKYLKANDLSDLHEIKTIELPHEDYSVFYANSRDAVTAAI